MITVLGLSAMALMFVVAALENFRDAGMEMIMVALLSLGGLAAIILLGPVGRAIASMLEGTPQAGDAELLHQVDDLQHRLALLETRGLDSGEVEQAFQRLSEMESRMDFTERLLTQSSARAQPPGQEIP